MIHTIAPGSWLPVPHGAADLTLLTILCTCQHLGEEKQGTPVPKLCQPAAGQAGALESLQQT